MLAASFLSLILGVTSLALSQNSALAQRHGIRRGKQAMQVIECIEGYYDIREVEFDAVHGWCPGCVLVECDCGEVVTLTESEAACVWCGADHARVVREELDARELEDERARYRRYGRIEATGPESNARGILASASQARVA